MSEKLELVSWENAGISNNFIFRLALDDIEICQEQLEVLLDVKIAKIDFSRRRLNFPPLKFFSIFIKISLLFCFYSFYKISN